MAERNEPGFRSFLSVRNFRDLVIVCVLLVITWKLTKAPISLNIKEISFNDLLSLFLGLFAIGLSVAFYFKASDTSNAFYDNSYKFTKDMSEILGRIEAGFGEKLKHLDEGYAGIRDRFDKFPFDAHKAQENIKEEEEEVKQREQDLQQVVNELIEMANIAEAEKRKWVERFTESKAELDRANGELASLRDAVEISRRGGNDENRKGVYALVYIIDSLIPRAYAPTEERVLATFKTINLSDHLYAELWVEGIVDEKRDLTKYGLKKVVDLLKSA